MLAFGLESSGNVKHEGAYGLRIAVGILFLIFCEYKVLVHSSQSAVGFSIHQPLGLCLGFWYGQQVCAE